MGRSGDESGARQRWDERYARLQRPGPPSPLLSEWMPSLPSDVALDLACGTGANLLALADRPGAGDDCASSTPLGVDISPVALHTAAQAARERGLRVDLFAADVARWPFPRSRFGVFCVFRFLDRRLAPYIAAALRPGGYLLYQTFTVDQLRFGHGPRSRRWLLERGELPTLFPSLRVLHYDECLHCDDDRPAALASLVARRET